MCGVEKMSDEINEKRNQFLDSLIIFIPAIILLTLSILHFKGIFTLFAVRDGFAYLCGGIGLWFVSYTVFLGLDYMMCRSVWNKYASEFSIVGTGCIIAIIAGLLRIPGWDGSLALFGSNLLSDVVCNLCCWGVFYMGLFVGDPPKSGGRGKVLLRRRTCDGGNAGDDVGE